MEIYSMTSLKNESFCEKLDSIRYKGALASTLFYLQPRPRSNFKFKLSFIRAIQSNV